MQKEQGKLGMNVVWVRAKWWAALRPILVGMGFRGGAWATLLPLKMVSPWQGWGTVVVVVVDLVGQSGNVCSGAAAAQAVAAL